MKISVKEFFKQNKKAMLRVFLLSLIVFNLIFIYAQSMLPPEKSSDQSDKVGEIVGEIIPPDTKPGQFVQLNLRKIAHFVEFFMLGITLSLYVSVFHFDGIHIALSYPMALFLAFIDESIQLFTDRGPSVKDVWLDFLGFVASSVIFYTGCMVINVLLKKRKQKFTESEEI